MKNTRILSVTSGKGGVGKTTLITNLAFALAQRGQKVLIFDGDLGMANVDLFFGVKAKHSFIDVLDGRISAAESICELHKNIHLMSGGHGLYECQNLNSFQRRNIVDMLESVSLQYDWILMDTSPGISDNVLYLNAASDQIVVIVTPDPASFADSYALIKLLNQKYKRKKFSILLNQVKSTQEGISLFSRFEDVVRRFLEVGLDFLGTIPQDQALRYSNQNSRLIMRHEPKAVPSLIISKIAEELDVREISNTTTRGTSMFWEQVVGVA